MERATILPSLHELAVEWYERLHRDKVTDETRHEFETWVSASGPHREAYESVERAWVSLQSASNSPQIIALRHETALRLTRKTSAHTRPWRWTVAAAVVLATVAAALFLYPTDRPVVSSFLASLRDTNHQRYQTATGERLAFVLSDGSQVTLDTESELTIDFSSEQRRVRLTRGQAFFEVAKDAHRPFIVGTHNRQFVAVGTAFDVRIDGDQVKVTMVEGTVRVESVDEESSRSQESYPGLKHKFSASTARVASLSAAPIATITAGEQLVSASHEDHVRAADPDRDTSWRRGQVIFENSRLIDAVTEINRYSQVKIELGDPSLADLRLSGAFATGRTTVFIEAVTSYFPVKVSRDDDAKVVLEKRN